MTNDRGPTSAHGREDANEKSRGDHPDRSHREPTKPAGTEVAPPGERVDDEAGNNRKKTQRQE